MLGIVQQVLNPQGLQIRSPDAVRFGPLLQPHVLIGEGAANLPHVPGTPLGLDLEQRRDLERINDQAPHFCRQFQRLSAPLIACLRWSGLTGWVFGALADYDRWAMEPQDG